MRSEKRREIRYDVLGHIKCNELSPLNGSLVDISLHGCKIYYTVPVTINLEDDYTLLIQASDSQGYDITLICHPVWVNEDSGKTIVGMSVLHSPDSEKLNNYIEFLNKTRGKDVDDKSQIVDTQCQFL